MKSFRMLLRRVAALLLCAATLSACKDTDGNPQFGDTITLKITIDEVASDLVRATVTPSRADAGYYAKLYPLHEIDGRTDNTLLGLCMTDYLFTSYLHQGRQTLSFEKLRPGIEYVLVVFGYEDKQSTGVSSKLLRERVATPAAE